MRIDKFNKIRLKSDKWKKIFENKKLLVSILVVLMVLGLSIGYSALASNLNISGVVTKVRLKSDIRITGLSYDSSLSNGAEISYSEYNKKSISMGVTLTNTDSTATFKIDVTNIGNVRMMLNDIYNSASDTLAYEIKIKKNGSLVDYSFGNTICDDEDSTKCSLGAKTTFYVTVKNVEGYVASDDIYNINLEFDFQPVDEYICTPVTTSTYGNVPKGNFAAGDEYICQVSEEESYHFFVTTSTNDEVSLLMEQNLDSVGSVAWITQDDFTTKAQEDTTLDIDLETMLADYYTYFNKYGPVTALNALNTYTKANNWIVPTSLPNIKDFATVKNVNLDDLAAIYAYIPIWANINLTDSNFTGYWTIESVNSSGGVVVDERNEYQAGYDGWYEYAYASPDNLSGYGLRPLITVPKTSMEPPSDISTKDDTGGTDVDYSNYYCKVIESGNNNKIICGENDNSVLHKTYTMIDYSEGTMCYYMIDEFEPGYNFSSIYGSLQNIQDNFENYNVIITPAIPSPELFVRMGYCWEDTSNGYEYSCSNEYICSGSYWMEGVEKDSYALTNVEHSYGTCSIGVANDETTFETLPGFRYMIGIELSDIGGFTGNSCYQ